MPTDAPCVICGSEIVAAARREIGMHHCMTDACIAEWRRRRLHMADLVLVFRHKQGLVWIKPDEVPDNDMTRNGGQR